MLAFTRSEEVENKTVSRNGLRILPGADERSGSGVRIRQMGDVDLERVLELRSVVRWSADPAAFDLLRGVRDARWAVAEASDGSLAGMVGAVPFGRIGILCHLGVHDGYRRMGLGYTLSSWAVIYLRSRGAKVVRLYSTRQAERLYLSLGFRPTAPRTVYRLEERTPPHAAWEGADGHRVDTLALGDLPELYGVDRWSYGGDRSPLIFATLNLQPGRGLVARDSSGRIKGYLIRSASGHRTRFGPFVASTPGVARLLLAHALEARDGSSVEIAVSGPTESPAHDLLHEFGFSGRKDRLRMELGEESSVHQGGLEQYGTTPYLAT
ncbi:MAG TPA: GNAT family N-acetyltransferase [Rubrobacteraceae bacterium]|nr:GNAT family N-acetyltransferase [Rubrobacteraceae bacterium]